MAWNQAVQSLLTASVSWEEAGHIDQQAQRGMERGFDGDLTERGAAKVADLPSLDAEEQRAGTQADEGVATRRAVEVQCAIGEPRAESFPCVLLVFPHNDTLILGSKLKPQVF